MRHTTTDRDGKRIYRSTPSECRSCPRREECGANEKGQKMVHRHIWSEYLDLVEQLRKTERGKALYAKRKESIERVFGTLKKNTLCVIHITEAWLRVTNWVTLKFAC
ncbi:MAG: transposase [Oscillospiraceae bacterium]